MSVWALLLIAVGVSADAFAVAVGRGLAMRRLVLGQAVAIAVAFGSFQAVMPVLGWLIGSRLDRWTGQVDHWVAFVLLALLGGRMVLAGLRSEGEPSGPMRLPWTELLVLSVATSIDAFAVGVGFAVLHVDVLAAAALIGLTTCVLSFVGVLLGHRIGARWRTSAEIAGGLVLIGVGAHVLVEHLMR